LNTLRSSNVIDTHNYSSEDDEDGDFDDLLSEKVTESGISFNDCEDSGRSDLGGLLEDPETRTLSRKKHSFANNNKKESGEKSAKSKDKKKEMNDDDKKPQLKSLSRKRSESPSSISPRNTVPNPSSRSSTTTTASFNSAPSDSFPTFGPPKLSPIPSAHMGSSSPVYLNSGTVQYPNPSPLPQQQQQQQPYGQPSGGYGQSGGARGGSAGGYGQPGGVREPSGSVFSFSPPSTQQGYPSQQPNSSNSFFGMMQQPQQQQQQHQQLQPQSPQRPLQKASSRSSESKELKIEKESERMNEECKKVEKLVENKKKQMVEMKEEISCYKSDVDGLDDMLCETQPLSKPSSNSSSSSKRETALFSPSKRKSSAVNTQPVEVKKHSMMRGLDCMITFQYLIIIIPIMKGYFILQVTIKFFKNKLFFCKNKGKFKVFEKLDCNLQYYIFYLFCLSVVS
jgi:hypothetical protein